MPSMLHFTNKSGWNGIRSAPTWRFRAHDPPPGHKPKGAYFTTLAPDTPLLARRLGIPRTKLAYVFRFVDVGDLQPIKGPRGRHIFWSKDDYDVEPERQLYAGPSEDM